MSSILDALKKLEEERAARAVPVEAVPFEPEQAGRSLFGKEGGDGKPGTSPVMIFVAAGVFAVVIACASVAGVLWYTQPGQRTEVATGSTPPGADGTSLNAAAVVAGDGASVQVDAARTPAPTAPTASDAEEEVEATPETPAAEAEAIPEIVAEPEPEPEPVLKAPAESAPAPAAPVVQARVEPVPVAPVVTQPEPTRSEPLPSDIGTLPPLRVSDEVRYGLEGLQINGLREPNRNRPYGVAIINMERIYLQETIPGTKAKLVGLNMRGIAIEIQGTGERFFVRSSRMR